jgi:hypothetical protein
MSENKDDKWEMPKPVFRSTTGDLPKSFEETISTSFSPDKTGGIDEDDDILSLNELPTEPANRDEMSSETLLEDLPREPANRGQHEEEPIDDHPAPADPKEAAEAEQDAIVETQPKRATFWSFTTIFLLIVLLAGVVAIALFYYLASRAPAGNLLE